MSATHANLMAAALVVILLGIGPALAGKRVALVIGNSAYAHTSKLPNPVGDARAMADNFRAARFDEVDLKTDVDASAFKAALREFTTAANDADIAVVYFAGHGLEVGGQNYLVPVDAELRRDIDVEDEAVSLDRVQRSIAGARTLRLVILDACRDDPFASAMKRTGASRSVGRGLARIEEDEGNSLVAFAAKAGSVAADGDGLHSPFTTALLAHLTTPGLDIRFALGKVRDDVIRATRAAGTAQVPAVYGSYGGDALSLVPASEGSAEPSVASVPPPKTTAVPPQNDGGLEQSRLSPPTAERAMPPNAGSQQIATRDDYSFPVHTEPDGWAALKAAPNIGAPRLMKVYDGTLFVVDRREGAWSHVRLRNGRTGWIISRLVGCCQSGPAP